MMFREEPPVIMGFHATSRGFGWALFQGPGRPLDWGIAYVKKGDKNAQCVEQVRTLVTRFRPEILACEVFDGRTGKRASRMAKLNQEVSDVADGLSIDVETYSRSDVQSALGLDPSATRQTVAERVSEHIEAIRHRMPPERQPWDGSDRRMALFSAMALVLTAYTDLD